jgi:hypothetical protein
VYAGPTQPLSSVNTTLPVALPDYYGACAFCCDYESPPPYSGGVPIWEILEVLGNDRYHHDPEMFGHLHVVRLVPHPGMREHLEMAINDLVVNWILVYTTTCRGTPYVDTFTYVMVIKDGSEHNATVKVGVCKHSKCICIHELFLRSCRLPVNTFWYRHVALHATMVLPL